MAEKIRPVEQMLELSEDEANSPEHLDSQVQKAQEQLLQLKRQQEQIEKQKRELEELSRRQDELEHGRSEMADKLTRSLVVLEREAYNATVDEARTVYNEQRSRLQAAGGNEGDASLPDVVTDAYESNGGRSFSQWFQIGVALTLPLIIFGAIALALFTWLASK